MGLPSGYEVYLYSDNESIKLPRTSTSGSPKTKCNVRGGLDANIVLELHNVGGKHPARHASVSLIAYLEGQDAERRVVNVIVGAEHIVFSSGVRLQRHCTETAEKSSLKGIGFYFRDAIGDTSVFPRTDGVWCGSPGQSRPNFP